MSMQTKIVGFAIAALGLFSLASAQQKAPPAELKLQVVFNEFDGEKKIGTLPYVLTAVTSEGTAPSYYGSLRLGINIPIKMLGKGGEGETQYQTVGTNIDCHAWPYDDGRFKVSCNVERSSVYAPGASGDMPPANAMPATPLLRTYRGQFDLLLRDGQTGQGPVATDPQSGRVLKTEVTLTVKR